MAIPAFLVPALENIYISPSELCNLHCRFCYTPKTVPKLSESDITRFISRYQLFLAQNQLSLKSVLFCGGEVFTLKWFIPLVNQLLAKKIFISIITNGTLNYLSSISDPANCQLIVSLDGPETIHDQNRGQGNFQKSMTFIRSALDLNFPLAIFYLVTKISYPFIDSFPSHLSTILNLPTDQAPPITYLTDRLGSLTQTQVLNLKRHYPTYPHRLFGCFQLALQADAHFYGCCESSVPLGSISDPIPALVRAFADSLTPCLSCPLSQIRKQQVNHFEKRCDPGLSGSSSTTKMSLPVYCNGCCQPTFLCGYPRELNLPNCRSVVQSLHDPA